MAIMFNDLGAQQMLAAYFNNTFPGAGKNLVLRLFTNNITPADTDVDGTYTEASGGGYSSIALSNGSWTVSKVSSIEQAAYAKQTFTFTGPLTTNLTIYGYYVEDLTAPTSNVIFAQLLSAPFTPANNGDTCAVTPVFQLSHGTPSA